MRVKGFGVKHDASLTTDFSRCLIAHSPEPKSMMNRLTHVHNNSAQNAINEFTVRPVVVGMKSYQETFAAIFSGSKSSRRLKVPDIKGQYMDDYELRFVKRDGSPTLVYHTSAQSDQAAIVAIEAMEPLDYEIVEVWQGLRCLHTETHGNVLHGPAPSARRKP
jgi:hypothetical protein